MPVAPPTIHSPISSPTVRDPVAPLEGQIRFYDSNGMLELPRYNRLTLFAPERGAVLRSLMTEKRDAAGNILRDLDGNPIMVPVRRGMNVFAGQVLGVFEDREHRSALKVNEAQLKVAEAERDKEIEVIYAAHGVQLAMTELRMMRDANLKVPNTYSLLEIKRSELALKQANAGLELQQYNIDVVKTEEVEVRKSELERTKVQIELRRLVSTIDGIVVDINAAEGEWLREGEPAIQIVQLDTLWVNVQVGVQVG